MVTELVEKTNDMVDATDLIKVTNNDEWKLHEETIAGKKASYIKMMRNKKMYVYINQYINADFFLKNQAWRPFKRATHLKSFSRHKEMHTKVPNILLEQ